MLGFPAAAEARFDGFADEALVLVDEAGELPLGMPLRGGGEDLGEDLHHFEQVHRGPDLRQERVFLDVDARCTAADLGVAQVGERGFAALAEAFEAALNEGRLQVDHEGAGFEVHAERQRDGGLDDLRGPSG